MTPAELKARRLAAGLSRDRLAALTDNTVHSMTIYRIEEGKVNPHRLTMEALEKALEGLS